MATTILGRDSMKLIVATGYDQLDEIISEQFEGIEVVGQAIYGEQIVKLALEKQAEIVLFSETLPISRRNNEDFVGAETNIIKIVEELVDENVRVVMMINQRPSGHYFLEQLIQRGVYDLIMGDNIHIDYIKDMLFQPRTRKDVKHLITEKEVRTDDEYRAKNIHIQHQQEETEQEQEEVHKSSVKFPKMPSINFPDFKGIIPKNLPEMRMPNVSKFVPKFEIPKVDLKIVDYHIVNPKIIAVGSLHGGAGSTFFLQNFSRYISSFDVPCGIIETPSITNPWYKILSREEKAPASWKPWHLQLREEATIRNETKWEIDGVYYMPLSEEKDITDEEAKTLLQVARQIPILFVDLSSTWDDPLSKQTLQLCDELWVVTQPDPAHLFSQKAKQASLNLTIDRLGNKGCVFIGNKWSKDVHIDAVPIQPIVTIPYFTENIKAMMKAKPLYSYSPKLFSFFDALYERVIGKKVKGSLFNW